MTFLDKKNTKSKNDIFLDYWVRWRFKNGNINATPI